MTTYYALTSTGSGYFVKAYGGNKQAVRNAAEQAIGDVATEYGTDIYKVTEQRNLIVVPETKAKTLVNLRDAEQRYHTLEGAVRV